MNIIALDQIDINNLQISYEEDSIYWESKFWGTKKSKLQTPISLQLNASIRELKKLGLKVPDAYELIDVYKTDTNFKVLLEFSQKATLKDIRRRIVEAQEILEDLEEYTPKSELLAF